MAESNFPPFHVGAVDLHQSLSRHADRLVALVDGLNPYAMIQSAKALTAMADASALMAHAGALLRHVRDLQPQRPSSSTVDSNQLISGAQGQ